MDYRKAVLNWCVKPDSAVIKGQVICEAEVEKAVIEIPSPCTGKLIEIIVADGCECDIRSVLAYIETEF